jgi:hypothetical protein
MTTPRSTSRNVSGAGVAAAVSVMKVPAVPAGWV